VFAVCAAANPATFSPMMNTNSLNQPRTQNELIAASNTTFPYSQQ
jgi:hypothetical protein